FPAFEDGHAVDGAGRIVERAGVDDVVGADHDDDVRLGEIVVDLVHFEDDVVGDVGFGEQHVHVTGKTACHGMNREAHLGPGVAEGLGDFVQRVLGLGGGHAVARDHDDVLGGGQEL